MTTKNLERVFGGAPASTARSPKAEPEDEKQNMGSGKYITLSIPEDTWKSVLLCQAKLIESGKRLKKYEIVRTALEEYKKKLEVS